MKRMDRLLWPEPAKHVEPFFIMCSGCRDPCPSEEGHVIPHWNPVREVFLTTYRCSKCWKSALSETRDKIKVLDADLREKFCKFLERHGFYRCGNRTGRLV